MPDHGKNSPHIFLNRLSTETLRQILREDFASEACSTPENDEFITCVMEVIAQREADDPAFPRFDAAAGWEDFLRNWRPDGGEAAPERGAAPEEPAGEPERRGDEKSPRAGHAFRRVLRIALIAVAAVCLCAAAAGAAEMNVFEMVAYWTRDMFQFRPAEDAARRTEYEAGTWLEDDQTLKPLLEEAGITRAVCPSWVPEGYALADMHASSDTDLPLFLAHYEKEGAEYPITVSVTVCSETTVGIIEKDGNPVTVYRQNGIDHYLMGNLDLTVSAWLCDNLECSIYGPLTETEMKTMIDSIYEE